MGIISLNGPPLEADLKTELKTACKTEEMKHVSHMTGGECTFQILHANL